MRDPQTFETRLEAVYRRFADEVTTDVDPLALARAIAIRPARPRLVLPQLRPLRLVFLLGLMAVAAVAAAVVVGEQQTSLPAPAVVSNGLIAFAANPNREDTWLGEFRDIYVTGEGIEARRIIGTDDDGLSHSCPSFSPDGSRLAFAESTESVRPVTTARGRWPVTDRVVVVVRLDVEGNVSAPVARIELPPDAGLQPCPEWSPGGAQLAFLTGPELWVADAVTGVTMAFPVTAPQSADFEWSPDGSAVAVNEPGRIRIIPVDGTTPIVLPVTGDVHSLDWTEDGRRIVYFNFEEAIRSIAIHGGDDLLLRSDGWSAGARSLAVSPDGSMLAYLRGCFEPTCEENPFVVVMGVDGSNEVVLGGGSRLSWSPDGTRLLFVDGAITSIPVTPGTPQITYPSLDLNLEFVGVQKQGWQPVVGRAQPSQPAPSRTPVASPATIAASGTTDTAIGQLSWTKVRGDASNLPFDRIFQTPGGFAAIEPDLDGRGSRFWVSTDGIDWVVAPMPVPAAGVAGMGQTAGEYWIWSATDFRLWRSDDFDTWTEVALDHAKPPVIAGVDWAFWSKGPVTVGTTTVLPWGVYGKLAVDELLGIPLAPGETLTAADRGDPKSAPGERDIYRARTTINNDSHGDDRVKVGSIRVEVDGSIVTVYDAESDEPVARIDASMVGVPAADLADSLEEDLYIDTMDSVVVIEGGDARRVAPPPGGVADLVALDGRFIALTGSEGRVSESVRASRNGIDWESLQPLTLPSSFGAPGEVLDWPARDADEPLIAAVRITEDENTQRLELWSSTNGQTWVSLGVVYTYPATSFEPMRAPNGYLATGDDYRLRVSATGADWDIVDGPDGVGGSLDEIGGARRSSSTSAAAFTLEAANDDTRVLWVFQVDPAATPSPSP